MRAGRSARQERLRIRPKALTWFGWLVLTSTLCNVLSIVLFAERFRADASANGTARAGWLLAILLVVVIDTFTWWLTAIRAHNIGRWLYILLIGSSLLNVPDAYAIAQRYGWLYGSLMFASYLLGLAAAGLLFRRDVARWVSSRGQVGEVDLEVFS